MLTDTDHARLRHAATNNHKRRRMTGATARVQLCGGPLDGIDAVVGQHEARGLYLGWCVVTALGPAQALYRRERPGRFTFAELELPRDWAA